MELEETRNIMRMCGAFEHRLKNLKMIEENNKINFPAMIQMFGFQKMTLKSKEELSGRIKELQDLLNIELQKEDD